MLYVLAAFAGCMLHPGATDPCQTVRQAQYRFLRERPAVQVEWNENGTVRQLNGPTGIFLPAGAAGFKVGESAPEVLEKLGPVLLARGTEELRVWSITTAAEMPASLPIRRRTVIKMVEYIRGRQVHSSSVNLGLDPRTNEVMLMLADFVPDRGLEHKPRLSEPQARAKLEMLIHEGEQAVMNYTLQGTGRLAYTFQEWGTFGGGLGAVLVWLFPVVSSVPEQGEGSFGELGVDAATGQIAPRHSHLRYWTP
jgi:hypothetical protein